MGKYNVLIRETLERKVRVSAESREDALEKVIESYRNCEIVLDSEDYTQTMFQSGNLVERRFV